MAYLKSRMEVDSRRIGVIGHSEGGVIAAILGARDKDLGYVILMAAPGVRGDRLIVAQAGALARASGVPEGKAKEAEEIQRRIVDAVIQRNDTVLKNTLRELIGVRSDASFSQLTSPWYRYMLSLDPAPHLRGITCPILAMNGSIDTQVPAELNLSAIRETLNTGSSDRFEVLEIPGLNHLFQMLLRGQLANTANRGNDCPRLRKLVEWIFNVTAVPPPSVDDHEGSVDP